MLLVQFGVTCLRIVRFGMLCVHVCLAQSSLCYKHKIIVFYVVLYATNEVSLTVTKQGGHPPGKLEKSGNLTLVWEKSGKLGAVRKIVVCLWCAMVLLQLR